MSPLAPVTRGCSTPPPYLRYCSHIQDQIKQTKHRIASVTAEERDYKERDIGPTASTAGRDFPCHGRTDEGDLWTEWIEWCFWCSRAAEDVGPYIQWICCRHWYNFICCIVVLTQYCELKLHFMFCFRQFNLFSLLWTLDSDICDFKPFFRVRKFLYFWFLNSGFSVISKVRKFRNSDHFTGILSCRLKF